MRYRLITLRKNRNFTQAKVAEKLGTNQSTISNLENGIGDIPTDMLVSLSKLYNVSTDYIVGVADDKRNEVQNMIFNKAFEEYYDLISNFKTLNEENKITVKVLIERLNESQKEK